MANTPIATHFLSHPLAKVIRKLSDPKDKQHVPFRESNLTRILQPALGGNNKTSVLCCITQSLKHLDETINTLGFALRAKRIQNNVSHSLSFSSTLDTQFLPLFMLYVYIYLSTYIHNLPYPMSILL